jgi:hypothetical protein
MIELDVTTRRLTFGAACRMHGVVLASASERSSLCVSGDAGR